MIPKKLHARARVTDLLSILKRQFFLDHPTHILNLDTHGDTRVETHTVSASHSELTLNSFTLRQ